MPAFPGTRVQSINRALVRAGCLTLTGPETAHPSGPAIVMLFDLVLESLAAAYPWQHFKGFAKLNRDMIAERAPWTAAFVLPADRMGPPTATYASADARYPVSAYELRPGHLFTDETQIFVRYRRIVEPGLWPGYFTDLFTLNLAAEYALAIREDERLRASLLRECFGPPEAHGQGGRFAYAANADAQAEPAPQIGQGFDPLTAAYRGL